MPDINEAVIFRSQADFQENISHIDLTGKKWVVVHDFFGQIKKYRFNDSKNCFERSRDFHEWVLKMLTFGIFGGWGGNTKTINNIYRFCITLDTSFENFNPVNNLDEAITFWYNKTKLEQPKPFTMPGDQVQKKNWQRLLHKLKMTQDYTNPSTQKNLANRVANMLNAINNNPELTNILASTLSDGVNSCGDMAAATLSKLEQEIAVYKCTEYKDGKPDWKKLFNLAKAIKRLTTIDVLTMEKYEALTSSGQAPDLAEILLAYQLGLKKDFELPFQNEDMLFRNRSMVTTDDIKLAKEKIRSEEVDPDHLKNWMVEWEPLTKIIDKIYADELETLQKPFYDVLNTLDNSSSSKYNNAAKAIANDRINAIREFHLNKITELLASTNAQT